MALNGFERKQQALASALAKQKGFSKAELIQDCIARGVHADVIQMVAAMRESSFAPQLVPQPSSVDESTSEHGRGGHSSGAQESGAPKESPLITQSDSNPLIAEAGGDSVVHNITTANQTLALNESMNKVAVEKAKEEAARTAKKQAEAKAKAKEEARAAEEQAESKAQQDAAYMRAREVARVAAARAAAETKAKEEAEAKAAAASVQQEARAKEEQAKAAKESEEAKVREETFIDVDQVTDVRIGLADESGVKGAVATTTGAFVSLARATSKVAPAVGGSIMDTAREGAKTVSDAVPGVLEATTHLVGQAVEILRPAATGASNMASKAVEGIRSASVSTGQALYKAGGSMGSAATGVASDFLEAVVDVSESAMRSISNTGHKASGVIVRTTSIVEEAVRSQAPAADRAIRDFSTSTMHLMSGAAYEATDAAGRAASSLSQSAREAIPVFKGMLADVATSAKSASASAIRSMSSAGHKAGGAIAQAASSAGETISNEAPAVLEAFVDVSASIRSATKRGIRIARQAGDAIVDVAVVTVSHLVEGVHKIGEAVGDMTASLRSASASAIDAASKAAQVAVRSAPSVEVTLRIVASTDEAYKTPATETQPASDSKIEALHTWASQFVASLRTAWNNLTAPLPSEAQVTTVDEGPQIDHCAIGYVQDLCQTTVVCITEDDCTKKLSGEVRDEDCVYECPK
jgi:hypothetical protein